MKKDRLRLPIGKHTERLIETLEKNGWFYWNGCRVKAVKGGLRTVIDKWLYLDVVEVNS